MFVNGNDCFMKSLYNSIITHLSKLSRNTQPTFLQPLLSLFLVLVAATLRFKRIVGWLHYPAKKDPNTYIKRWTPLKKKKALRPAKARADSRVARSLNQQLCSFHSSELRPCPHLSLPWASLFWAMPPSKKRLERTRRRNEVTHFCFTFVPVVSWLYCAEERGNARAFFLRTFEENLYFIENKSHMCIVYCFILPNFISIILAIMFKIIK